MNVNDKGLGLIQKYEGFRARAYRDAVGVWTIGFGHTSMAGSPQVKPGMTVSRERAAQILETDIQRFSEGVAAALTAEVNDNQFSALVSFAYNVGLGNFRKSGVLAAVNAGDHRVVPRRLALWNKAGGRVLPGLVARRAAEAALYAETPETKLPDVLKPIVEEAKGKALARSKTAWSAGLAATAAAIQSFWLAHQQVVMVMLGVLIIAAAAVIIYERYKKSKWEGV